MSIVAGFDRFEGLAIYKSAACPDGREVIVKVGERHIDIETVQGENLAAWAPGSYQNNQQPYPDLVVYADETESLHPLTKELADFFLALSYEKPVLPGEDTLKQPRFAWVSYLAYSIVIISLLAYTTPWLARYQAQKLAIPAIQANIDAWVTIHWQPANNFCNPERAARALSKLSRTLGTLHLYQDLPQPALILPSGAIALDQSALAQYPDERALSGQILATQNQYPDTLKDAFAILLFPDVIKFLLGRDINHESRAQFYVDWRASHGPITDIATSPERILTDREWEGLHKACNN